MQLFGRALSIWAKPGRVTVALVGCVGVTRIGASATQHAVTFSNSYSHKK
jgi:hypothetical protein